MLGGCGNDGLFLQVQYPLDATTTIDFTKLSLYEGNISPAADYHTYDQIDALINTPHTGFIVQGYQSPFIGGWILMDDGTIGNASSGASNRANVDTFPLYNLIYNNVIDTWAPVSGGRTSDAVADFTAGKTLTLPRQLGRVIGTAGSGSGLTARVAGEYLGEESHTLSISEMPAHNHPGSVLPNIVSGLDGSSNPINTPSGGASTVPVTVANQGGGAAHNIMQPSSFGYTYIKL